MIEFLAGGGALALAGFSVRYTWWRPSKRGVPVLMYHHITDRLNGTALPKLRVTPERFARQLDHLKKAGFQTITLSQAVKPGAPEKSVVLSFDDGYLNFYEHAWPLLKQRGMTATVFLVTGALDGFNHWDKDKGEPEERLMGRDHIRELADQGVEFGGHSHSHLDLTQLDDRGLMREVTGCQKALTDLLGHPARTFSYPFGLLNDRVEKAVSRAGFILACTTRPGKCSTKCGLLRIPRIIVKRSDDSLDFRLKLTRSKSRL